MKRIAKKKNSKIGSSLPLVLCYIDEVKVSDLKEVRKQDTDSNVVEYGESFCMLYIKNL